MPKRQRKGAEVASDETLKTTVDAPKSKSRVNFGSLFAQGLKAAGGSTSAASGPKDPHNRDGKKRRIQDGPETSMIGRGVRDPSEQYLSSPTNTPMVRTFRSFFSAHAPDLVGPVKVYVGPVGGWRTLAKLSVRQEATSRIEAKQTKYKQSKPSSPSPAGTTDLRIGLFAPGSHRVVEIPDSRAHAPSLNRATKIVKASCAKARVRGYVTGSDERGGLGYLVLSEERATKRVQLTLVFCAENENQVLPRPAVGLTLWGCEAGWARSPPSS